MSLLVMAYGFEGKTKEATKLIYELKDKRRREYLRPYILAEDYAALGEKNEAMDWLEKAYEERDDCVALRTTFCGPPSARWLPALTRFTIS